MERMSTPSSTAVSMAFTMSAILQPDAEQTLYNARWARGAMPTAVPLP
ncbi:unnamed protein product [Spirodela intermedia]|uniref:Uncharacterized protein n=2 Tax=Spirodela intermedia TaxID=51605 RepID=A0A7I8KQH8_SPIIN|nr:unnamed protein product [Spirodela intermedia]CAA6663389.1 unnamed protein product [Spirodela intermedia]CAA7399851.1 unnamed protein product [Spirodela intermedia]